MIISMVHKKNDTDSNMKYNYVLESSPFLINRSFIDIPCPLSS